MSIAEPPRFARSIRLDRPTEDLPALVGSMRGPALLGGGPDLGPSGRWSILAARPRLGFEAIGDAWTIRTRRDRTSGRGDPLGRFGRLLDRYGLGRREVGPGDSGGPPFRGGLIGAYAYDLAPLIEDLPRKAPRDSRVPDIWFRLYDTFVAVDHLGGEATLWGVDLLDEGTSAVERRFEQWRYDLDRPLGPPTRSSFSSAPEPDLTPEQYRAIVRRALDYIAAGDIFQANITQRFACTGRPEGLDLFLRLRRRSASAFAAFLGRGDLAAICSSPELFIETRGDRIVTRPIKGTRPRGESPREDAEQRLALVSSAKDRAELAMIVDLERNDLGRVCEYGTVTVAEAAAIESFATVHHRVATIEGRLRPDVGPIGVIRALFPGGSITGAPKIRAMQIIDELEPTRRGLYTGAIGYYGLGRRSAFNIAIRTIIAEGNRVSYQVGGGIVADSDPDSEYEETLHKGRAMRDVLEGRA